MSIEEAGLRSNAAWVFLGNTLFTVSQWLMLVVLANFGSADAVGDYTLALGVTVTPFILGSLQLRAALSTDHEERFDFRDYVIVRGVGILAAIGASIILAITLFSGARFVILVLAICAIKTFDLWSDLVYGLLQRAQAMRRIGVSKSIQAVSQFCGLAAAFVLTRNLSLSLVAVAAASALTMLFYDTHSLRLVLRTRASDLRKLSTSSWNGLVRLTITSAPLGLAAAFDALNFVLPRFVLEAQLGRASVGYYSAVAYLFVAQGLVLVAVADAFRPRMARVFATPTGELRRLSVQLVALALAASTAGLTFAAFFGELLLTALYGDDYGDRSTVLVWLMVAAIPWNLAGVVSTFLTAARRFKFVLLSFGTMTAVTLVSLLLLVPDHGEVGAAWAIGLGMLVRLLVSGTLAVSVYRMRLPSAMG